MKIAEVESLVVGGGQFVRIATDSGLVGTGQTACWGYPSAVDQVVEKRHAVLRVLADQLCGPVGNQDLSTVPDAHDACRPMHV